MEDQASALSDDWQPTCDLGALRLRAQLLKSLRRFFEDQGYLEVETPLLSADVVVDAHIDPFPVPSASGAVPRFLQTSPEAAMKRLLAADIGSIFQITKSFRQAERGSQHNPEFTILEWYGVGTSCFDQMDLTERLVQSMADAASEVVGNVRVQPAIAGPFSRVSYKDAFQRVFQCDPLDASLSELRMAYARVAGAPRDAARIDVRDDLLNLMLAEYVEPTLGKNGGEFLHNYPMSQAALAIQCPNDAQTARRFELYMDGMEFCNGYEELTDTDELLRREAEQNGQRRHHGSGQLPGAARLAAAMQSGLPPCSGVAMGFDRLVMFLGGYERIEQVIPFPIERA